MCGDLCRVAGQPVERLGQRLDVFDQPGDAVLEQRPDRVGRQRQPVQRAADDPERAVDPAAVAHARGDQLDVLGDPHPGPRARRGLGHGRDQWVGHRPAPQPVELLGPPLIRAGVRPGRGRQPRRRVVHRLGRRLDAVDQRVLQRAERLRDDQTQFPVRVQARPNRLPGLRRPADPLTDGRHRRGVCLQIARPDSDVLTHRAHAAPARAQPAARAHPAAPANASAARTRRSPPARSRTRRRPSPSSPR